MIMLMEHAHETAQEAPQETEFQIMLRDQIERSGYTIEGYADLLSAQSSAVRSWLAGKPPRPVTKLFIEVLDERRELLGTLERLCKRRDGKLPSKRERPVWKRRKSKRERAAQ